jgi:hypothetical protein
VELAQHLDEGKVGSYVVDDSLGAILDQEFEQLEGLSCFRLIPGDVEQSQLTL